MVTSVTKDGTQKLPQNFKIVETYWHDHSIESSWGALSDDITLVFQLFSGKMHFLIFFQKTSGIKELKIFIL
jgi:hypothetical protein